MAVANVVAKFEADISDVQAKMSALQKSFKQVTDDSQNLSDRLKNVGTEMSRVGKGMTIGLTLPLAAVGAAAIKASVDFESSMSKIVGLVGIASDEVKAMQAEVLALAGDTAKSPVELADALFVVTSAGLRGQDAMQALDSSARAGAAGLGETADIARSVAGALSAYGSDVLSAADATDQIVATARAGNFETSQFAAAIGQVLPFAQQAGATFADMGGAVALLTRTNGNAAKSVTQMTALFRAFVVPTEQATKGLAAVGLSAQDLRDSIAKDGLPATLKMLDKALGGNREQLGRILGSSEATSAAFQILGADAQTLTDTFGVVADSAGMTQEAFDAAADTAGFKMQQAMVSLQATLIGIGDIIVPLVTEFAKFAKTLLDGFSALPGPMKTLIVAFAGVVAVLGPILWIGGKVVAMFGTVATAAVALRTKMSTAFATIRTSIKTFEINIKTAMIGAKTQMGAFAAGARVAAIGVANAFRSIGAAAKGMLASLGPVGWAIIGVSIAYEVLSGRSAEAEARVAALTDALSRQGDEAQKAAAEVIASSLLANEWGRWMWIQNNVQDFQQLADIAGISMAEITAAVMTGGAELERVMTAFTAAGEEGLIDPLRAAEAVQAIQAQADAFIDASEAKRIADEAAAIGAQATAVSAREQAGAYRDAAAAARAAADGVVSDGQRMTAVTDATADAVRALKTAFDDLNGIISQSAAQDRMTTSLREMKATFDDAEASGMDYRDAIRQYMTDASAFAKTLEDPRDQLKVMEGALKDVEKQMAAGEMDPKTSKLYKDMKGAVKAAKDEVKTMETAIDDAKENGLKVAGAIAAGIEQGMSEEQATLGAAGTLAGDTTAQGLFDALGMNSPSKVAMEAGRNTGVGLVQGLNQMRSTASGAGMNLGANVVRGMITALNNGQGPIAAAARAFVAAAIAAAKAESQEGSPSKVFMGIGDNMVRGLVIGVTRSSREGANEMSKAARLFMHAFMAEFQPREMGAAESAIYNAIANAEQSLRDARDQLKEANRAAKEAEKALAEARKDGDAKAIAKAERDLAKAREDVNAATNAVKLAEWVRSNEDALKAIQKIAAQYDYIVDKMEGVKEAFASIRDVLATPLGTESDLSRMFALGVDPRTMANNYMNLAQDIRDAFAVLTDPKIVGRAAARANRRLMNQTIQELEGYVTQIMALQEEYEANVEAIATNEEKWRKDESRLSAALAEATKAYDEVLAKQKQIRDGFRSFVNDIGKLTDGMVSAVKTQTRELANGVRLIVQSADTSSASGVIAANMKARLDEIKTFSANVKTLMERGLDPSLIRDFVEAGVSSAGKIVADLASATDDELQTINETQAALLEHAGEFAESYLPSGDFKAAVDAAKSDLEAARIAYEAERDRLDAEQKRIEGDIALLVTQIEGLVTNMMTTLVPATEAAAQASIDAMIAQFEKDFPRLKKELGALMDALAKSMKRTVTISVVADTSGVGGTTTGTTTRRSFAPGSVVIQTPSTGRSVMVSPNAVSVNVNAGAGVDRAALVSQVKAAVDESLESLAREIVAS